MVLFMYRACNRVCFVQQGSVCYIHIIYTPGPIVVQVLCLPKRIKSNFMQDCNKSCVIASSGSRPYGVPTCIMSDTLFIVRGARDVGEKMSPNRMINKEKRMASYSWKDKGSIFIERAAK